jgi:hypothetical protein
MSKSEGHNKALTIAKNKLLDIDINERSKLLGFKGFQNKSMQFKLFDNQVIFHQDSLTLMKLDSNEEPRMDDTILFFHYLLYDAQVNQSEPYISFRELPGGQFYWETFRARSVIPLVKRIANDLDLLKKNLARFDWEPHFGTDFSVRIHAIGNLNIVLSYQSGDEEFPPAAYLQFPKSVKYIYSTEDVVVMASRICLGLL